ncbi:MAG TPA: TolC family protein, partial [Sulfuricurvum sp.]|nr:TolC family protein [Sulfuricurvum sp.]
TLPLYTGGKLSGYEKIAQEREAISQIETTNVTVQKIYQTKKSYYDAALIHSSLIHMKTILANIETLEKTTQGMITEGYAKKVDLLEVQAKKVNAQRLIAQMEANQKLTLHYLSFLLNQSVTEIALPQDETVQSTLTEADVMATNLDMQKASKGLEIRESMIQVANASYLPQVGAFAEASSADDTFLGNFSDHKAYTVGAKLTWNLFSGGADAAGLEKARIEQLKTKTDVELSRKAVALQYDQMKTEITALDLQITTLEQEVELANEIYRNYMGRYREHLVSMSDLLIKHSEQIERILNLQTIKNQRNERIFALEKLSNGAHL